MKNKPQIVILFLLLLVLPSSTVLACQNASENERAEEIICFNGDWNSEIKLCCENNQEGDDGNEGTCDNSSCHCLRTVNISVLFHALESSNRNVFIRLSDQRIYVQHLPKAVYLSIWQPPKIS